jgi:hypothetical protein
MEFIVAFRIVPQPLVFDGAIAQRFTTTVGQISEATWRRA